MPKRAKNGKPRSAPGAAAGRVIRRLCEDTELAQEAFAVEVGRHRTYMGLVERGLATPSLSALAPILKRLGLSW
jgi:transcriptional regulator with XRE-family HTH domain